MEVAAQDFRINLDNNTWKFFTMTRGTSHTKLKKSIFPSLK